MKKKSAKSDAASGSNRPRGKWIDPDDAPEITDAMLDRATVVKDGRVLQRGRPPLGELAKRTVTIRLDADVLESYRSLGRGWQTRLNEDLRRIRKVKKAS